MIKIGVSACFMAPNPDRKVFGPKWLNYLERDMAHYLLRDDVLPILIPDLPKADLYRFLNHLDGLVFQGGSDMAPESYGEVPIQEGRWLGDAARDAFELEIMDFAIKSGRPAFGICRGFQVMNVYFGGTLYQDIESQLPNAYQHRDADAYDHNNHQVHLIPGGLLDKLHQDDPVRCINSVHHQAVKDLGKGMKVEAISVDDDLVEAFSWEGAAPGKVMGVQWHPEFAYNSPVAHLNEHLVYEHFLSFCRA